MGSGFARALTDRPLAALALCFGALSPAAAVTPPEALSKFPVTVVTIAAHNRRGSDHVFKAWVADTAERHAQGLMYQRTLAPDRGMLFVFSPPQVTSFWMKNTYLSLDILFVAPDGRITRIVENAKPLSTESIPSMSITSTVLELNAGTAQRLRLAPGDRLSFPPPGASH